MIAPRSVAAALSAIAAAVAARGQDVVPPAPERAFTFHGARLISNQGLDHYELRAFGGFTFAVPSLGIRIRGGNAVLLTEAVDRSQFGRADTSDLPRRTVAPPAPRRRMSADELRERIERTMHTFGQGRDLPDSPATDKILDDVRFLYFEGGVIVDRDGIEMLRCERLWISPLDDRIVAEEFELRYLARPGDKQPTLVVRGPRIAKSGPRWTGRDLELTTCVAAEPHLAVAVGEAEIIEHERELEVRTRDQHLRIGGAAVVPLPDAHFFTGSQSQFPIKSIQATYSAREGVKGELLLGLPWNATGGAVHEWLTGRPAAEFRGDWELGIGYVQKRGVPLRPAVEYRAEGLYEGRTEGFWLDDQGSDIREIRTHVDSTPIDAQSRGLLRTRDRVELGTDTHLDVQAFYASDPAVLSEFFPGEYRVDELPETSAYLHHGADNHLFTFGARTNLDRFSYRDNRALADRFVEELPVATWNWLAEPVAETPWETPVVLDVATELGQRRSDWDPHAPAPLADRTFRADQQLELSLPFQFAGVSVRPYLSARATYFDDTVGGGADTRVAFEGGVQFGTRFARSFDWTDDVGTTTVRHVIAPKISILDRFQVDGAPSLYHQFDATDALTERNLVRVEVRNMLQRTDQLADPKAPADFLMLDLAQDLWPEANRDNGGEHLGLFYYDLLVRPQGRWVPFDDFSFALYGDHDWKEGLRTLDSELRFGPFAGATWTLEYRTDRNVSGAVGISASTRVLDRWALYAHSLYDLENSSFLTYGFGIRRDDHDWAVQLGATYNPFTDETTVRLDFVPKLPFSSRQGRFGPDPLHDAVFATQY
ncbi:MAG: LPS assembly protein LptD [Planctomycetota bacterium]